MVGYRDFKILVKFQSERNVSVVWKVTLYMFEYNSCNRRFVKFRFFVCDPESNFLSEGGFKVMVFLFNHAIYLIDIARLEIKKTTSAKEPRYLIFASNRLLLQNQVSNFMQTLNHSIFPEEQTALKISVKTPCEQSLL